MASSDYAPRREPLAAALAAVEARENTALHGCRLLVSDMTVRITRELAAVARAEAPTNALWDGRWALDGPHAPDLRVRALGDALDRCRGWREAGLPRATLLAAPAIWRGDNLVAAPVAEPGSAWTARAPDLDRFVAISHRAVNAARHDALPTGHARDRALKTWPRMAILVRSALRGSRAPASRETCCWEMPVTSPSGWSLFLLILALFNLFSGGQTAISSSERDYSEFIQAVESGEVSTVTLDGERILYQGEDGSNYYTIQPEGADITDRLIAADVDVKARPQEQSGAERPS